MATTQDNTDHFLKICGKLERNPMSVTQTELRRLADNPLVDFDRLAAAGFNPERVPSLSRKLSERVDHFPRSIQSALAELWMLLRVIRDEVKLIISKMTTNESDEGNTNFVVELVGDLKNFGLQRHKAALN